MVNLFKFATDLVERTTRAVGKKIKHVRMIKKYDESFDESTFAESAQSIYIKAHECLAK